jgi:hypothetical protein
MKTINLTKITNLAKTLSTADRKIEFFVDSHISYHALALRINGKKIYGITLRNIYNHPKYVQAVRASIDVGKDGNDREELKSFEAFKLFFINFINSQN